MVIPQRRQPLPRSRHNDVFIEESLSFRNRTADSGVNSFDRNSHAGKVGAIVRPVPVPPTQERIRPWTYTLPEVLHSASASSCADRCPERNLQAFDHKGGAGSRCRTLPAVARRDRFRPPHPTVPLLLPKVNTMPVDESLTGGQRPPRVSVASDAELTDHLLPPRRFRTQPVVLFIPPVADRCGPCNITS